MLCIQGWLQFLTFSGSRFKYPVVMTPCWRPCSDLLSREAQLTDSLQLLQHNTTLENTTVFVLRLCFCWAAPASAWAHRGLSCPSGDSSNRQPCSERPRQSLTAAYALPPQPSYLPIFSAQESDQQHSRKALPSPVPSTFIPYWHFLNSSLPHLIPNWHLLLRGSRKTYSQSNFTCK